MARIDLVDSVDQGDEVVAIKAKYRADGRQAPNPCLIAGKPSCGCDFLGVEKVRILAIKAGVRDLLANSGIETTLKSRQDLTFTATEIQPRDLGICGVGHHLRQQGQTGLV